MFTFGYSNRLSGPMRALVAVAIGVIMVLYNEQAMNIVVKIIAALIFASGLVSLVVGLKKKNDNTSRLMNFNAVVDLVIASLLFMFNGFVANLIIYLIGFALLGFGLFQIFALFGASRVMKMGFWPFVMPFIVAGAGIFLLFNPEWTKSSISLFAGIALLIYGVSELLSSWKVKKAIDEYEISRVEPRQESQSKEVEPVVKDGRIWGRGADDDKGQLFMHAKAFEAMCATETLPCNVKFMLEGEEEIGSPSLYKFCEDYKEMLKADIILVSDTSMISMDTPSITCGLRGLTYMEVEVVGPNKDLHSGLFGGAVANPANVLTKLVASLTDERGRVTIPGFYDDVRDLTPAEREAFNQAPFNLDNYKKALDIDDVEGEAGYTTIERTGVRPSLDVNGIWGGYIEEGTKTVIPSRASAKISMRLVPNQDFVKIGELFEKHFRAIAPKSVKVNVKFLHGGAPYVSPTDMTAYKAAEQAIVDTFGKKPLPFYSGGSIPIISGFERILGIKSILIGFGLSEDAIHSPNESYGLEQFDKGVRTIPMFYKHFAEME